MDVGDPASPPSSTTTDARYQNHGYLRGSGLVHALLTQDIEVGWAIGADKVNDHTSVDFSAEVLTSPGPGAGPGIMKSYRAGAFVVGATDADAARSVIASFNAGCSETAAPFCVHVHEARAPFTAPVYKALTAAPSIAVLRNGEERVMFRYLNAAGIPTSTGTPWPATNCGGAPDPCASLPEVLGEDDVAGCPGSTPGACTGSATTGALFDSFGEPAWCTLSMPHYADAGWSARVAQALQSYLARPTAAFFQCTSVTTFEDVLRDDSARRPMTTAGIDSISDILGSLQLGQNNVGYAQTAVTFTPDATDVAAWRPKTGSTYHGTSKVHARYLFILIGDPVLRDLYVSGRTFGDPLMGRFASLAGHDYCAGDACLTPILQRAQNQGVRYFLNALLESPCGAGEGQPAISLDVTAPALTNSTRITFDVTWQNTGNASAREAVIELALPAGATFVSATGGGVFDGVGTVTWSPSNVSVGAGTTVSVTVDVGDGSHVGTATFTHVVGRTKKEVTDAATVLVDTAPPSVVIDSGPTDPTDSPGATLAFHATEVVSGYECALDAGSFSACTSPIEYSNVTEGAHTFRVRATDLVGNTSAEVTWPWTVDRTGPPVTIDSGPTSPTRDTNAQFTFSSTESNASFECSVDGGAFGACAAPMSYVNFADGTHIFQIRAVDALGNIGPIAARSWTVDTVPPDTILTLVPASPTQETAATLEFRADEGGATFECRLDDASFASCQSPLSFTGLADGTHTFEVRALDAAGNSDPMPARHVWVVDTTPPDAPQIVSPTQGSTTRETQPTITGRAEPGARVEIVVDGVVVGTATADAQGNWSYTLGAGLALGAGPHTVKARATDAAGNTGPYSADIAFTVDLTASDTSPPDTRIDTGPAAASNSNNAIFTFSSTESGSTFECSIDNGPFTSCQTPRAYSGLSEGTHEFEVRATDPAGNTDPTPATTTWLIDLQAPAAPVITAPANGAVIATARPVLRGTAEPLSRVTLSIDGRVVAVVQTDADGNWSYPLSESQALADGTHTVSAVATDAAGNASPSSQNLFTVDTVAPDQPIITSPTDGSVTSETTVTVAGSAEAGSRVDIIVDGEVVGTVTAGADGRFSHTLPEGLLTPGDHTITATAKDAAGNVSQPSDPVDIGVDPNAQDTTAPDTIITQGPDALTSDPDAALSFVATEAGSTFTCTLDGATLSTCQSPEQLTALADGAHEFTVSSTDAAGNTDATPAVHRWTVDTVAPDAPVIESPTDGSDTTDDTPTVSGTAEPGSTVTVMVDGQVVAVVEVDAGGHFTATTDTLTDGTHTITATATDGAGNVSPPSDEVEVTVVPAVCGDGVIGPGEQCDDLNATAADGCSSSCQVEPGYSCTGEPSVCRPLVCGDGEPAGEEECDDANTAAGDGCSATCDVEPGWVCLGAPSRCAPVCGNTVLNVGEQCDDGNITDGDGCTATCGQEDTYGCADAPATCSAFCGDGVWNSGEECDDGDLDDGDGCAANCIVEPGYVCTGEPSLCIESCGNGRLDEDEACDDGNGVSGDGCSSRCSVENGWACDGVPSRCSPTCGNGRLEPNEECDDGGNVDGNGCSAACRVEPGHVCGGAPSICARTCGNSVRDAGEECDDGNELDADGCSARCLVEPGYSCPVATAECTASCGDGIKAMSELCDDGNQVPADGCGPQCVLEPGYVCTGQPPTCARTCGNGLHESLEECDDGNQVSDDGCTANCSVENGWYCPGYPSVCVPICGDGVLTGGEACDDADLDAGDGCDGACLVENGWACSGSPSECTPVCGDGRVVGDEACDDANTSGGDGCDGTCGVEGGWTCAGAPSDCDPICGDGVILGEEECDDGDTDAMDGCGAQCDVEPGWACSGAPSVCLPLCGNGRVDANEACDDGNMVDGDGCAARCEVEPGYTCVGQPSVCVLECGNGRQDDGEQCDDGDGDSGDGCDASCNVEPGFACTGIPSICTRTCGDGRVTGNEHCDDGNRRDGDGCSASCEEELGWTCSVEEPTNCARVSRPDAGGAGGDSLAGYEMSGGGCGCSTSSSPVFSSEMLMALLGLCWLGGRRRRAPRRSGRVSAGLLVVIGLLPVSAGVRAEEQTLASQRWQGTFDPHGFARTHSGALLSHLDFDVGMTGGYERNPLMLRQGGGISGPLSGAYAQLPFASTGPLKQRAVRLIGERLSTELTFSIGLFNWVQLFAALPMTLYQAHGEGAGRVATELDPLNQFNMGDLRVGAKVRLLRQQSHFVDLAVIPMVTLPVGVGFRLFSLERNGNLPVVRPDVGVGGWGESYTSEGFPTLQPELALSRELFGFVAAGNVGLRLRRPYELHGLTVTHELLARAGIGFKGRKLAEKVGFMRYFPVELGLEAVAASSINLPYVSVPIVTPNATQPQFVVPKLFQLYQHSLEVTGQAGVDVMWTHPFVTASLGVVPGFGTPDFRVGAGIRISTDFGFDKPLAAPPRKADRDGDGVPDDRDDCPDLAGPPENGGCPIVELDSDGDGVGDATDKCIDIKEDPDGYQDDDGCPEDDNDGDGIADPDDRCPLDPETVNGVADEDGCPDEDDGSRPALPVFGPRADEDGDGLMDDEDACARLAEDADAFEDFDGCPEPDNDRDGLADGDDQCPLEAEVINGVKDEDGCPDEGRIVVILQKERIQILEKVYFKTNSDEIQTRSHGLLNQVAAMLRAHPSLKVRVEGHTDDRGNDAFNLDLSQRRAESVRAYLLLQGMPPERLEAVGYGETRPVADNRTTLGQDANRRVEFVIIGGAE